MAMAHAYYFRGIDASTASNLLAASHQLLTEREGQNFKWNALTLVMSSGGGDVISAFGLYNELKGLGVPLTTHNAGAVDSAAILPFIAGTRRTASATSVFFFHQLHWTFAAREDLPVAKIGDAALRLSKFSELMAGVVSSRSKLDKDRVIAMMRDGASLTPTEAKAVGLIDDIVELATPQTARTWIA